MKNTSFGESRLIYSDSDYYEMSQGIYNYICSMKIKQIILLFQYIFLYKYIYHLLLKLPCKKL